jgi:GT2 family glycosyltransferase
MTQATVGTRLSVLVPFHSGLEALSRCLEALDPLPPASELIIAADGALEDCSAVAAAHHGQVVVIRGPAGPAVARNVAAMSATGDVLVFIDADVVVSAGALERLLHTFVRYPGLAAVFGAYDEDPADPGFVSQYKNLSHAFVHQSSSTRARTFWAGFGAIRRDVFVATGGFDERLRRSSVEDIDLGYRLTAAGHEIRLDSSLIACHLKRWTLASMILSDVRDRGIPWTQLVHRYGALNDDLNLRVRYRWSVVLAYLALAALTAGVVDARALGILLPVLVGLTLLNLPSYRFFYRKRGIAFTARAWVLHVALHVYNGASFATGTALFLVSRYLRVRLPGALPVDPWNASCREWTSTSLLETPQTAE